MARWPVLVGFSIGLSMTSSLLGCAATPGLTPGLPNVPNLGGSAAPIEGVPDVVANGHDSCEGVSGRSALRGHLPPCPTLSHPVLGALPVMVPARGAADESLVQPWLEHFYVGFPCAVPGPLREARAVAWSARSPTVIACATPP